MALSVEARERLNAALADDDYGDEVADAIDAATSELAGDAAFDSIIVGASGTVQGDLDVRGAAAAGGSLYLSTNETTVADGDVLGRIDFNAPLEDSGTDAILAGASIWAEADATFSASVNTTDLVFATGTSAAAAEKWRITADGELTSLGAAPSNVAADGAVLASGGIAFTDVLNAWIDDATHGDGTTTTYIGNETIDTSASDARLKNIIGSTLVNGTELVKEWARGLKDYTWKSESNGKGEYVGLIAQEFYEVAPHLVKKPERPEDTWSIKYQYVVPYLMKAFDEMAARVEELEKQLQPVAG